MRKGSTYHVAADIRACLRKSDSELVEMFNSTDGEPITGHQIREHFIDALREGYDVMPPCDNVRPDGHCDGHPKAGAA